MNAEWVNTLAELPGGAGWTVLGNAHLVDAGVLYRMAGRYVHAVCGVPVHAVPADEKAPRCPRCLAIQRKRGAKQ